MARIRSPGYPSFSLEQAVEYARKVHAEDRQHPVDRATAARHMGFSGLSGASDRALSALMHFELAEKVHKGEIRITDRALRILHPNDLAERREALYEAGFAPDLFKELRERYPDAPPSRDSLGSYLLRSGFASAAIPSATRSYLETCFYLQREAAYESGGDGSAVEPESAVQATEDQPMQLTHQSAPAPVPMASPSAGRTLLTNRTLEYNEPYLDFRGSHVVHVEGLFDLNGIVELEAKLKAVKMLLKAPPAPMAAGEAEDDTSH